MAKVYPSVVNFNAGEFSALLDGRVDIAKYPNAASTLENFILTVQGPIKKRPGTRHVNNTRANYRCVLMPFEYSVDQTYIVEFTDGAARFHTTDSVTGKRGTLVDAAGNPVEIPTPYSLSDLLNSDGSTRLRWAQSGDVVYICCPGKPVYKLSRTSATSFEMTGFFPGDGPFEDVNSDQVTYVYLDSAAWGGRTYLRSTSPIFTPEDVGGLFYMEPSKYQETKPWVVDEPVWTGNMRKSDGKYYIALNTGYTGTAQPVHTEGTEWDGPGTSQYDASIPSWKTVGVNWQYHNPGYGYVAIRGYVDAFTVIVDVYGNVPNNIAGWEGRTPYWAFGAWSPRRGFPTAVAFFRSRLWFARGQKLWSSVVEDFGSFEAKSHGEVTADMAISMTLSSGQINDIQWLLPDKDLIAGTAAGEFSIGELTNGEALGPGNVRAVLQSEYGSKAIQPVKNGRSILFIQSAGLKAREFEYNISNDGYVSADATVQAEHMTRGGVIAMAFAQEPDPIIWMLRADKKLIGFTWNNEQEVKGWHRHETLGEVESIAVIPAFGGGHDELWLSVKRTINGQVMRFIEYMAPTFRGSQGAAQQYFVDCGLSYSGTPVSTVGGLSYLEGQEVAILADGATQPNAVVSGGQVELPIPASVVHVGLPYTAKYRSMRIEMAQRDGSSQARTKRINRATYRLLDTGACYFGPDFEHMDPFQFRTTDHAMDNAVPLFSGDEHVEFPGDYEKGGYIALLSNQPFSATLVAIFPEMEIS